MLNLQNQAYGDIDQRSSDDESGDSNKEDGEILVFLSSVLSSDGGLGHRKENVTGWCHCCWNEFSTLIRRMEEKQGQKA